jgi:PAS domain S-box-containing protein
MSIASDARHAVDALQASEQRQVFLLKLSDVLGPLSDPVAVEREATRLLGEQLEVNRAFYADVDADGDTGHVRADYVNGVGGSAGTYSLSALAPHWVSEWRAGRTTRTADVLSDPWFNEVRRAAYATLNVRAALGVPVVKAGRLVAMLGVNDSHARDWTDAEAALVEDVAERTWAAIDRARAETAMRTSEEGLRLALEAGRMGTYRFDVRTGVEQWSDSEYALLGLERTAEPATRELFLSLVHPQDLHLVQFTSNDQRPEGTSLDSEFRIIRPDTGETRYLTAHAVARFGPDGQAFEVIGINQDVTEERLAQAALRSSEERLQRFSEGSSDVLWIRDAKTLQWTYLSPRFDHIYGMTRQDALKPDSLSIWVSLIVSEDRDEARAALERVRSGERVAFEYRIRRPDGEIRWMRDTDFPMRDPSGAVTHIAGVGSDITFEKTASEHQRLLLDELQHRVRNSLSIIRLIARRSSGETAEDYQASFLGRLDAFARVQTAVTRNPASGLDLATMIADELGAFSTKEGEALQLSGPEVALEPRAAERLGLAIHELATNAVKYGAISVPGGRLSVSWSFDAKTLSLVWLETGLDELTTPTHRGFGSEIIERTLAYDLGATTKLEFLPTGARCEISFPRAGAVK